MYFSINKIPLDELRSTFSYCAETGVLTRKHKKTGKWKEVKQTPRYYCGRTNKINNCTAKVNGMPIPQHHIAWVLTYGIMPSDGRLIDHKDANPINNRISNLRIATASQNQNNREMKGYFYDKTANRFRVKLCIDGKQRYFGSYVHEIDAKNRADQVIKEFHGEFTRK